MLSYVGFNAIVLYLSTCTRVYVYTYTCMFVQTQLYMQTLRVGTLLWQHFLFTVLSPAMPGSSRMLRCARASRQRAGEALSCVEEGFVPLLFLFIWFLMGALIIWQLILILPENKRNLWKWKQTKKFPISLNTLGYLYCVGWAKSFLILPVFAGLFLYSCFENPIKKKNSLATNISSSWFSEAVSARPELYSLQQKLGKDQIPNYQLKN